MSKTMKISNGDIIISSANGRPVSIADNAKLHQDIAEFFSVNVTPNGFGSGIESLIGVVQISQDMFTTMVERQIRDGLARFMAMQRSSELTPRPTSELIASVSSIFVQQNPSDPTMYYFRVNFLTKDGQQSSMTTSVSI